MFSKQAIIIILLMLFKWESTLAIQAKDISITILYCNDHSRSDIFYSKNTYLELSDKSFSPDYVSENRLFYKKLKPGIYNLHITSFLGDKRIFVIIINDSSANNIEVCFDIPIKNEVNDLFDNFKETDTLSMCHTLSTCLAGDFHKNLTITKVNSMFSINLEDSTYIIGDKTISLLKLMMSELYECKDDNVSYSSTNLPDSFALILGSFQFYKESDGLTVIANYYLNKIKESVSYKP